MDLGQIAELVGLASTAAGTAGKAVSTVKDIKALISGDKAPDKEKVQELLNTLATQLTSANMMNVDLSTALRALSVKLQEEDDFKREKARYELFKTNEGAMVYKLRDDARNGQPEHFICPVCLNRDKLISFVTGNGGYRHCQTDQSHNFEFHDTSSRSRGYSDFSPHDF